MKLRYHPVVAALVATAAAGPVLAQAPAAPSLTAAAAVAMSRIAVVDVQTVLNRVLQDVGGIIDRVAKDRGYAMVIEKGGLLYASAEADVTEDIIRAYDQESATKGKK